MRAPRRDRRRRSRRGSTCPSRNGASQSGEAASAASDRSGQSPGSARRRNITRSRHCFSAFVHGSRSTPSASTPRASASASAGAGSVCSLRTSAPSRRRRRARKAAAGRDRTRPRLDGLDRGARDRLDLLARQRGGGEDARAGRAAGDFADRQRGLAGERARAARARRRGRSPSGTRRACRAPARCGRERRRPASGRPRRRAAPRSASATSAAAWRAEIAGEPARILGARANGRGGNCRAAAARSTASPPRPRSVSATARSAASAASPARAASISMRASRGGSASAPIARPSSVDAAGRVERAERRQQRPRLREGGARRRVEEFQLRGIGDAPDARGRARSPKDRPTRISGWRERRQAAGRRLLPETIADAGFDAPGAAAPLVGVGAADAHRLEPRQPDVGLVARHAHKTAVDDDAHALDGQRGLGDRGREHDLAPPRRRGRDGQVLRARVHRAEQRRDVDIRRAHALAQAAPRRAGSRASLAGRRGSSRAPRRAPSGTRALPTLRSARWRRGRGSASRPERRGPRSRCAPRRRAG